MNQQSMDFWQKHSLRFLEMALRTDKCESIENPDGYGRRVGACGDSVEIFLTVRDEQIANISFQAQGCFNTLACANTVVVLAQGRSLDEAWEIRPQDVIDYLETLPPEETHCAELVVGALYRALANVGEIRKNPWKKFYHRDG